MLAKWAADLRLVFSHGSLTMASAAAEMSAQNPCPTVAPGFQCSPSCVRGHHRASHSNRTIHNANAAEYSAQHRRHCCTLRYNLKDLDHQAFDENKNNSITIVVYVKMMKTRLTGHIPILDDGRHLQWIRLIWIDFQAFIYD